MPRISPPPDEFSARVREVVKRYKTQDEVAALTGIDRSDISGYCNGQKPDYVNLIKFCNALDLSPTWLLFGVGQDSLQFIRERAVHRLLMPTDANKNKKSLTDANDGGTDPALRQYSAAITIETLRHGLPSDASRKIFDREVAREANRIAKQVLQQEASLRDLKDADTRDAGSTGGGSSGHRKTGPPGKGRRPR